MLNHRHGIQTGDELRIRARANDPDRPYQYASAERLTADFDQVSEEILRFAGEETHSPPTVIHEGLLGGRDWE